MRIGLGRTSYALVLCIFALMRPNAAIAEPTQPAQNAQTSAASIDCSPVAPLVGSVKQLFGIFQPKQDSRIIPIEMRNGYCQYVVKFIADKKAASDFLNRYALKDPGQPLTLDEYRDAVFALNICGFAPQKLRDPSICNSSPSKLGRLKFIHLASLATPSGYGPQFPRRSDASPLYVAQSGVLALPSPAIRIPLLTPYLGGASASPVLVLTSSFLTGVNTGELGMKAWLHTSAGQEWILNLTDKVGPDFMRAMDWLALQAPALHQVLDKALTASAQDEIAIDESDLCRRLGCNTVKVTRVETCPPGKDCTRNQKCSNPPDPPYWCTRMDTIGAPHYCRDLGKKCLPHWHVYQRNQIPGTNICKWNKYEDDVGDIRNAPRPNAPCETFLSFPN